MKFGQFEKWCVENCKNITQQTRSKYMRLANNARGSDLLTTGVGLRQAYISKNATGFGFTDNASLKDSKPVWVPQLRWNFNNIIAGCAPLTLRRFRVRPVS